MNLAAWLSNYQNKNSIGSRLRARRIAPLLAMIRTTYAKHGYVNIIDVGGTIIYWNILPESLIEENRVTITLVNLPGSKLPTDTGAFRFVEGDGCDLSHYRDGQFHIAHSNSVIEHVGDWGRMASFASEIQRLAPNLFVQTPSFWFPIEPHFMTPFFHWLPKPLRISLLLRFNLGNHRRAHNVDGAVRAIESARLLDERMMKALFPNATILKERLLFLTKSLIAIRKENNQ